MGEIELIGACQQHLRNAELHLRSNNPKAYAASMSSVLELLAKELPHKGHTKGPEPDADRQPSGSEQLPTEPELPTNAEPELPTNAEPELPTNDEPELPTNGEADKNATAKAQEVAAEAHRLYGPLISSPEAEAKAEAEQADSESKELKDG